MTIDRYVAYRLGPGSFATMGANMFARSFTATSLAAFWRYWNPGFGFYLLYHCYQPLRRLLPHSVSLLLTFAVCGLAHDVLWISIVLLQGMPFPLPFVTCWFAVMAVGILAAEGLRLDFKAWSPLLRVPVHAGFLGLSFYLTRVLTRLV